MKVIAKQVEPEYQESPLFLGEDFFPKNIIVTGNSYFYSHNDELYKAIEERFDEAADKYDSLLRCKEDSYYKSVTEIIEDYFPESEFREPWNGKRYSNRTIGVVRDLLEKCGTRDYYEGSAYIEMLSALTGKEWTEREISGCCQSDWQKVIYPVGEWDDKALETFETEYFNTGMEFFIYEDENSDDFYSCYVHEWSDEGIERELKEITGADEVEIHLCNE